MDSAKPWYQSTTVISSIVSVLGMICLAFKLDIPADDMTSILTALGVLIAGVVSIIGRFKAKTKVTATAAGAAAVNAAAAK